MKTSATVIPRVATTSSCHSDLDSLPWKAGCAFRVLELDIGLRTDCPEIFPELKAHLMLPEWSETEQAEVDSVYSVRVTETHDKGRTYQAFAGPAMVLETDDFSKVKDVLQWDLHATIGSSAKQRVGLQGGAVLIGGEAVLLPANRFSGTSTLIKALIERGAEYVCDRFIMLDRSGRVYRYPLPLSIPSSGPHFYASPDQLKLPRKGSRYPVAGLVFARYQEGASGPLRELSPAEAGARLVPSMFGPSSKIGFKMDTSVRLGTEARIRLEGERGEADAAAARLMEIFRG